MIGLSSGTALGLERHLHDDDTARLVVGWLTDLAAGREIPLYGGAAFLSVGRDLQVAAALRAAEAWRRDGLFLSRTMEDERAHGRYVGVCEMAQAFGDAARSLARFPSHAELVARRAA